MSHFLSPVNNMSTATSPQAKKILIVDDEKTFVKYWTTHFENLGFDVAPANNGQQALDQLKAKKFDIVLLDLKMPVLDGFAVLKEWKNTKNADTPVYVITCLDQAAVNRAQEMGATKGFLKYNLNPKDLVEMVKMEVGG